MIAGFPYPVLIVLILGALLVVVLLCTAVISLREKELQAARHSLALAWFVPAPLILAAVLPYPYRETVCAVLGGAVILAGLILILPVGRMGSKEEDNPTVRIDERDVMFSRMALRPGSERFESYYRLRPENREVDDAWRARPGLMRRGATHWLPVTNSAARASFLAVEQYHPILDGRGPAEERTETDPARITQFLKWWGKKLGAVSVGITPLHDYHKYTVIGRGEAYGEPVEMDHAWAVALTVEMDRRMLEMAPQGPTLMESAQQYLLSGQIAVQIAEFIRYLGYPARAHIDGDYRVVCPLVARDAGLGEIGRMGLLMTPDLGPRVRLAVVTTDLPLLPDERGEDRSAIDFCTICRKCAEICPSRAIPFDHRADMDGVRRWRIDSEACFDYWCRVGTDCARCVRVCPYSHPDTALHDLVRFGVSRSAPFRRFALWMDDLLYGRKPPPAPLPDWMK